MKLFVKGKEFDTDKMAAILVKSGVRRTREYEDQKEYILDVTLSCDREEAMGWMRSFMQESIQCSNGSKNNTLRAKFLAAFDIHSSLEKEGPHQYSLF